jgi:hypothetical protein
VRTAEFEVLGWISRVVGDVRRDAGDQLHDEPAVEMDAFATNFGACLFPIGESRGIAEDDTDILQYGHRRFVDPFDLIGAHRFNDRQPAGQGREHLHFRGRPYRTARLPAAPPGRRLLDRRHLIPSRKGCPCRR